MSLSVAPISDTNSVPTGLPLSADFLRLNGHSVNAHPKSPNLPAYNIPVLPSSLLPILLQYLLPPSPAGMPPHLLARALSSRHRYLNIEPSEDLGAYYALSSASSSAVAVLEDIGAHRRAEDGFSSIVGQIGYIAECEYGVDEAAEVKSFVQLRFESREVSVVLIWEDGEWKYTDVQSGLLPEKLSLTPTLAVDSIRSVRKTKSTAKATKVVIQTQLASDFAEGDDSDDDYWARYGANSDSEDEESGVPRNGLTPFQKKGKGKRKANCSGTRSVNEDAYWAQYGTGSETASPEIGHRITLMTVQQQYDSIIDGEEDGHRELRTAIKGALAGSPMKPPPGAPKSRMLNLDLTSPMLHFFPSSSSHQTQPDTNSPLLFSSDSHRGAHNHSVPYPHLHTPSTRHETRDAIMNETLTLHQTPLQGIAQGLALDLNTPPPTEPTLSIPSMLPTMGSPTSTIVPAFTAAGSGPTAGMSPLLVGTGSPVVDTVERGLISGVVTRATGGSVVDAVQEPGGRVSLLDVLMRERRVTVTTNRASRIDGEPTKAHVGNAARCEGDEAVLQSVRGVFGMWRILRDTTQEGSTAGGADTTDTNGGVESTNEVEEKREFLSLVVRALADL